MKYMRLSRRTRTWGIVTATSTLTFALFVLYTDGPTLRNALAGDIVDFTGSDNETGFPYAIVPNVIHMIHFGDPDLQFVQLVAILAADRNHKPDKIVVHCNCHNMTGKYWEVALRRVPYLEVEYLEKPTHIFGKEFSYIQHASDVARLRVLKRYGGIYIDSDIYIVRSLNPYRKFEFTLAWDDEEFIGNQVLVSHKNARFLPLYLDSYRHYMPDKWYYNGGELPTTSILNKQPYLVHRVQLDFGVRTSFADMLYGRLTDEWRDFRTIHLLWNHRDYMVPSDTVKVLDEYSIQQYGRTFGRMARLILWGTTDPVWNKTLADVINA